MVAGEKRIDIRKYLIMCHILQNTDPWCVNECNSDCVMYLCSCKHNYDVSKKTVKVSEKHLIILKLWQCFVTREQMCCHLPGYASQETPNFDTKNTRHNIRSSHYLCMMNSFAGSNKWP